MTVDRKHGGRFNRPMPLRPQMMRHQPVAQRQFLKRSFEEAAERGAKGRPGSYEDGGVHLLLAANWRDARNRPFVVLKCNTNLHRPENPVVAVQLADDGVIRAVDLTKPGLDRLCSSGRLFIFAASMRTEKDTPVVVLPADKIDHERQPVHAALGNGGAINEKPFLVGRSGLGTFFDKAMRTLLIARPSIWSDQLKKWLWLGRSTAADGGYLKFMVDMPFQTQSEASMPLVLPQDRTHPNLAALVSNGVDDNGDPVVIVDPRWIADPCVIDLQGACYLIARPNRRNSNGVEIFAREADGHTGMVHFPYSHWEGVAEMQLEPNHIERDGRRWWLAPTNASDKSGHYVRYRLGASKDFPPNPGIRLAANP